MSKDIREKILQAALTELHEHGPQFHMDDLASRLSISKRTLYEYFPSKQEIIKETASSVINGVYRRHIQLLHNPDLTTEEKMIGFFTEADTEKVFSVRQTEEILKKIPNDVDRIQELCERDWQILEAIFDEARESDEFFDFDKPLLLHMLRSAADAVLEYIAKTHHDEYTYPQYMEKCIRVILYGIKKDRGLLLHDTKA